MGIKETYENISKIKRTLIAADIALHPHRNYQFMDDCLEEARNMVIELDRRNLSSLVLIKISGIEKLMEKTAIDLYDYASGKCKANAGYFCNGCEKNPEKADSYKQLAEKFKSKINHKGGTE